MNAILRPFCVALAISVCTSCATESLTHNPQSQILEGASIEFCQLKESGQVPGFAPDEHGTLQSAPLQGGQAIKYPFTVVLNVTKESDNSSYVYKLTKDNDSAAWRLTTAQQQLPGGKWQDLKIE
jgi:hypothetical protein